MGNLIKLSAWVYEFAEKGPYNKAPLKKLICSGGVLMFWWVVLLSFTYTWSSIITIPLLAVWAYLYYMFCIIWRAFKLSKAYLISGPIVGAVIALGVKYLVFIN